MGVLPAIERYISPRIQSVYRLATANGNDFLILSGKYGLMDAQQPIPWYDHLLVAEEIDQMVSLVVKQLVDFGVQSLTFYTADEKSDPSWHPYCEVIRRSTATAGVRLYMKPL